MLPLLCPINQDLLSMLKTLNKALLRVIPVFLAGLYYTIQTLCLYVGLKQQSLTRIVIVGFWSILHLVAWLVGNSSLGLFKGTIDRYLNNNRVTKTLAGIIPLVLAACLVTAIVAGEYVVPCVILNMAIGFPCIAAADAFADDTISKMLSDKYFGVVQYIATSIVGKGLFALMADNITSNGNMVFYLGWIFAIVGIFIHLYIVKVSENSVSNDTTIRNKSGITSYSFLLFTPLILKLWESIFTDVPLSSLKFIAPLLMYNDTPITSNTSISFVEVTVGLLMSILVSTSFSGLKFKDLWRKYMKIHGISTIIRVVVMIMLYYLSPISKGSGDITGTFSTSSGKTLVYHMSSTNLSYWQLLFTLIIIANTAVDAISSVLLIMLLKGYSRKHVMRYSVLDGVVRVYTFAAMMPIIKRNRMLSMYSSSGSIIFTLIGGIVVYGLIQARGHLNINHFEMKSD